MERSQRNRESAGSQRDKWDKESSSQGVKETSGLAVMGKDVMGTRYQEFNVQGV